MKIGTDCIGVGVGAVILNDKNEVLLQKRTEKCGNSKGCYGLVGGKVDFGETREQAIIREVKEEAGIDVEVLENLGTFDEILDNEDKKQHWIGTSMLCKIIKGTPKIMEPEKHSELKWYSLNNLPNPLSTPFAIHLENLKRVKPYLFI